MFGSKFLSMGLGFLGLAKFYDEAMTMAFGGRKRQRFEHNGSGQSYGDHKLRKHHFGTFSPIRKFNH